MPNVKKPVDSGPIDIPNPNSPNYRGKLPTGVPAQQGAAGVKSQAHPGEELALDGVTVGYSLGQPSAKTQKQAEEFGKGYTQLRGPRGDIYMVDHRAFSKDSDGDPLVPVGGDVFNISTLARGNRLQDQMKGPQIDYNGTPIKGAVREQGGMTPQPPPRQTAPAPH